MGSYILIEPIQFGELQEKKQMQLHGMLIHYIEELILH
jgi:hypothetical protein